MWFGAGKSILRNILDRRRRRENIMAVICIDLGTTNSLVACFKDLEI
ncbi:hypothetical protein [Oceanirhabdus seepicola]|uniref:Uncharacterized protein n=1 Tax=Oceanirhabdus seepicola TaxID=2828781 RepID=A0A9J6NZA3_9CLOT|nr:hypothetical protein [Oceanirhabdus seepicola]MCM1988933.1 hypothetical protein [Oceanirhabdus seepicola]